MNNQINQNHFNGFQIKQTTMSHSLNKIWIHTIWATKERANLIHPTIENQVYDFMGKEFVATGCKVRIINGMPEHIHTLFLLNANKALADIIKQVKGASSHWVNDQNFMKEKFLWQTGYAAYSVSESQIEKVYRYILNQKQHHQKMTFEKEYDDFVRLNNIAE